MPELRDPASSTWHLDKRVPIALIISLAMQTGVGVWFIAGLSQRVTTLEAARNFDQTRDDPGRITRVETKVEAVQRTIERMDIELDRLIQGPGK